MRVKLDWVYGEEQESFFVSEAYEDNKKIIGYSNLTQKQIDKIDKLYSEYAKLQDFLRKKYNKQERIKE